LEGVGGVGVKVLLLWGAPQPESRNAKKSRAQDEPREFTGNKVRDF